MVSGPTSAYLKGETDEGAEDASVGHREGDLLTPRGEERLRELVQQSHKCVQHSRGEQDNHSLHPFQVSLILS